MRSVIVVGPNIAQTRAVSEAFSRLGWATLTFHFQLNPVGLSSRVLYRILPQTKQWALKKSFDDCFQNQVIPAIKQRPPHLLLVLRGSKLNGANRVALEAVSPRIAVWVIDSLSRFPKQGYLSSLTAHAFYLDGKDVVTDRDVWLPMGYEESLYDHLHSEEKTIDVLFIGYIRGAAYSARRKALVSLGRSNIPRKWRCSFVGTTGTRQGDLAMVRKTGIECLGRVSAQEFAKHIASARVCVNVHQDDGGRPINSAFFQIPAAGTCQLAEDREYLHDWLDPGLDYVEFSRGDFIEVLERVLKDRGLCESVAAHGRRTVERSHSFTRRVEQIVEIMGLGS